MKRQLVVVLPGMALLKSHINVSGYVLVRITVWTIQAASVAERHISTSLKVWRWLCAQSCAQFAPEHRKGG